MNILLALDSKSNQEITHFLSQFQKDTYTCVTDGDSAINFIVNQRPDIILLDLILPKKEYATPFEYIIPYVFFFCPFQKMVSDSFKLSLSDQIEKYGSLTKSGYAYCLQF